MTTMSADSIRIGAKTLGVNRHICAFFHSKEEEYRVLQTFIRDGFDRGEKAVHIVDPARRQEHKDKLRQWGLSVERAEESGQLEVKAWEDAYLLDGYFDQDRMIQTLRSALEKGREQGYSVTRLVANMEWALLDRPGVEAIVAYESRLNDMLPSYTDPVICTYDLSRFNASTVMDMLRTHPVVIIGGILQENPLYVPPQQFLKELVSRRGQTAHN